jgi:acyl carrier protein
VDEEQLLSIVHQTASEITAANYSEVTEYGPAASMADRDSLIDWYGFSSIDTLQCLLVLEEKFGITLPDEDLSEEVLSSATALAKHISKLRQSQVSDAPGGAQRLQPRLCPTASSRRSRPAARTDMPFRAK